MNEVRHVVCIAHGQSLDGILVVARQGDVSILVRRAEGKRALSDHEVTLCELDPLLSNHLLVDVGIAEVLMHDSRTRLKSRHLLLFTHGVVSIAEVVVTNPLLEHFNFLHNLSLVV